MSLFSTHIPPLAERLRPKTIDDVIGQSHLLGEGKPLRMAFMQKTPQSMIFWGPPGVGKTTLARLCAFVYDCGFISLSAVFSGVKDIREAVAKAQEYQLMGRKTMVFIDEIHRFNKTQQDALLPYTESGLFNFIGATTENPSFEVNKALLSRSKVYVLTSLTDDELRLLFKRAQQQFFPQIDISDDAIDALVTFADGDARRLLNIAEQIEGSDFIKIDAICMNQFLGQKQRRFDKGGDDFYDLISALHKSVRGSNPDAALYWLCRMLDGGVDPNYLSRRIIRMAWEDIGLADPRAIDIALQAANTYERLGAKEGELAFAQAVIYLSVAPKSNAGYQAFNQALAFVKEDKSRAVPNHLKNAPTRLMKDLGYGHQYRYAHDEPNAYAAGEQYFPDGLEPKNWYQPVNRGLEIKIVEKLAELKRLDNDHKSKK